MALKDRLAKYAEIERIRARPLIVYVTSSRQNAEGNMAPDALAELSDQLLLIPRERRRQIC
jgi:hypothetical protein